MTYPAFQKASLLPPEIKEKVISQLNDFVDNNISELSEFEIDSITRLSKYLLSENESSKDDPKRIDFIRDLKYFLNQYDQRNNKNHMKIFPEEFINWAHQKKITPQQVTPD